MDLDSKWISATSALNKLAEGKSGRPGAKLILTDLLRDGLLRAKVYRSWVSNRVDFTFPARPRKLHTNAEVPADVWQRSRDWSRDLQDWRWSENQAIVRIKGEQSVRIFTGLKFQESQVESILGDKPTTVQSPERPRGPRTSPAKWALVASELLKLHAEGFFEGTTKVVPHVLATRLKMRTDEIWSDTTLEGFARELYNRMGWN